MVMIMLLPDKVIVPCWTLPQPVTMVGVMVGVRVMVGVVVMVGVIVRVGVSVRVGVTLGVAVNTGVFVAVSVGVLEGVNVGVFTVGVAVGEEGRKVEGGTVTTMGTLTKMVRALIA